MNDTAEFPTGWRVHAVPTNWDGEDPTGEPNIREAKVRLSIVPDDFYVTIQTEGMIDTAIIARFEAREHAVRLVSITGVGANWINHLTEVVEGFPPKDWVERAEDLIVGFLRKPQVRVATAQVVSKLPVWQLPVADTSPRRLTGNAQRRRRIDSEHLEEVARIYKGAKEKPTQAVQIHFAVSHSTAAKWVGAARERGLLPVAATKRGRSGEARKLGPPPVSS